MMKPGDTQPAGWFVWDKQHPKPLAKGFLLTEFRRTYRRGPGTKPCWKAVWRWYW